MRHAEQFINPNEGSRSSPIDNGIYSINFTLLTINRHLQFAADDNFNFCWL